MTRRWGTLCPDGHGVLLENPDWGDRLWCPANEHGGNGRFFDPAGLQEGYEVAKTGSGSGLTESQVRAMKAAALDSIEEAERPAQPRKERKHMAKEATEKAAPKRSRDPRDCECGCGGQTKGGRFLPGHDAKLHSRQKAEAAAAAEAAKAGI